MIPSGWELVVLLGVLVLLFGSTKLPVAARSIGQSMRIFKAETKGMRSDDGVQQQPPSNAPVTPVEEPPLKNHDGTDH
ncbi:MAG TPA: twin-arginine translocase TatA/TatE family subunit [Pseudonocardiaceae bacterium]